MTAREQALEAALRSIIAATHSHINGRDLLAELHPRRTLDIKRRKDSVETWFQGDWLSDLWREVKAAKAILADCEGGSPCTTCPDKRQCGKTGCVRKPEFIAPPSGERTSAPAPEVQGFGRIVGTLAKAPGARIDWPPLPEGKSHG